MDRASDSGSEGWGFESLPAYQKAVIPLGMAAFLVFWKRRTQKAGPGTAGVKIVRWTVFRPWKSKHHRTAKGGSQSEAAQHI